MHRRIRSIVATSAAATLLAGATAVAAGPSGAIFTTNAEGSWVNGNVYPSKEAVYLNGGPRVNQSCTAAGLPDGDYYFQVTDPSGEVLLSNDLLAERKIRVTGGVIDTYLGTTRAAPLIEGRCGGHTVQLSPFYDTTNPGSEYKVWLWPTPVSDEAEQACDGALFCDGSFLPSESKTDNFKVEAPEGTPD